MQNFLKFTGTTLALILSLLKEHLLFSLLSTFLYQRLPIRNIFLKKSQFVCEIFDKSIKDAIRDHKKLGFSQWKLLFVCFLIRQCVIIISIWKSP